MWTGGNNHTMKPRKYGMVNSKIKPHAYRLEKSPRDISKRSTATNGKSSRLPSYFITALFDLLFVFWGVILRLP